MRLVNKKTDDEKIIMKLRGITLDSSTANRIQFEKFKELVKNFGADEEEIIPCKYSRLGPTKEAKVLTTQITKRYKVFNNKSLVANDYTCYPFGYK